MNRLEIENFYSIRDRQVIDLAVSAKVPDNDGRFITLSGLRVPHVIALFGPNASGKSNILRALTFIAWFVQHSFKLEPDAAMPFLFFADESSANRPTCLAVEFAGPRYMLEPFDSASNPYVRYRYSLEIVHSPIRPSVVSRERLDHWPNVNGGSSMIFERNISGEIKAGRSFNIKQAGSNIPNIRQNCSVISMLCQYNHEFSLMIRQSASRVFSNILINSDDPSDADVAKVYNNVPGVLESLNKQINRIDLGVEQVGLMTGYDGPTLSFRHQGLGQSLPFDRESHGTRQFIKVFPFIHLALANGGGAIIDELDLAIHPTLLPEVIGWFTDPQRNPHHAQLWFSCQNASVMDFLEKEEIFFCSKDSSGGSAVYALADIEGVRRNDNFMRKYLGGVYGALPMVG